jgi:putative phosphoribosyl transferase
MHFSDRIHAGAMLAGKLASYARKKSTIILAVPRGGVVVGKAAARLLMLPLDVVIVKKIPHPHSPEFAIGAVGPQGVILKDELILEEGIPQGYVSQVAKQLSQEIKERRLKYKGKKHLSSLKGKTVILVDDGIATGYTLLAAAEYIKMQKPKKLVLAVPVAAASSLGKFRQLVDEVVCIHVPNNSFAVGEFYKEFSQVEDSEIIKLLKVKSRIKTSSLQ